MKPRVIVPYTEIAPGVAEALATTGWLSDLYPMTSETSYWDLLDKLWSEGETFIIVEHDVIVRPDTLDQLNDCPFDACAFVIPYFWSPRAVSLACTKFSSDLIARCPDLMRRVGEMRDFQHPQKHWCRLDMWIQQSLPVRIHPHEPAVTHYRDPGKPLTPSHGCS